MLTLAFSDDPEQRRAWMAELSGGDFEMGARPGSDGP
jgi:hypothetical protein